MHRQDVNCCKVGQGTVFLWWAWYLLKVGIFLNPTPGWSELVTLLKHDPNVLVCSVLKNGRIRMRETAESKKHSQ